MQFTRRSFALMQTSADPETLHLVIAEETPELFLRNTAGPTELYALDRPALDEFIQTASTDAQ